FASETKALLTLPELPRELDLTQLDAFLALQYVPRSGLRAVEKVPPGSYVVAEHGSVRVERYWSPKDTSDDSSRSLGPNVPWIERVREEVSAAVRGRRRADGPAPAGPPGGEA